MVLPPPEEELQERSSLTSIGDPAIAMLLGHASSDGVCVSEWTAMTLSAVFRATSIVADSVAALPLRTIIENAQGQKERSSSMLDDPSGPLKRFTPFEWKQLIMVHLLLHGNAFLQHVYNGAGALVALNPIHPSCVEVEWDDSYVGGKKFTVRPTNNKTEVLHFGADGLTQIMGVSLDGLRGLGVVAMARLSLGTGLQGDKAAYRTFANGAMISGLVTPAADEEFEKGDAELVKTEINSVMTGAEHAGDIVVMSRKLQFQAWQLSAADAQFLESRTFSIDEVGRWFGVPPHLLGLTEKATSWGQGIAEQNRGLARYTLSSWTHPIEERMTRLIPAGKAAEFDYTEFTEPSPEEKITLILSQVNGGLITPNEGRRLMNLAPLAGGDTLRLPPGSLTPAQIAGSDAPSNNTSGNASDAQGTNEEAS